MICPYTTTNMLGMWLLGAVFGVSLVGVIAFFPWRRRR